MNALAAILLTVAVFISTLTSGGVRSSFRLVAGGIAMFFLLSYLGFVWKLMERSTLSLLIPGFGGFKPLLFLVVALAALAVLLGKDDAA